MADEAARLELELKAELEALARLAQFLEHGCRKLGVPERVRHALELAADEAVTNVVRYAYAGRDDGWVKLVLERAGGEAVLTITDAGRPFDERRAAPPDLDAPLEDRRVGGLGLYFIHQMMDRVERERRKGINHLVMAKRLA